MAPTGGEILAVADELLGRAERLAQDLALARESIVAVVDRARRGESVNAEEQRWADWAVGFIDRLWHVARGGDPTLHSLPGELGRLLLGERTRVDFAGRAVPHDAAEDWHRVRVMLRFRRSRRTDIGSPQADTRTAEGGSDEDRGRGGTQKP